jgi:hypothetical protein
VARSSCQFFTGWIEAQVGRQHFHGGPVNVQTRALRHDVNLDQDYTACAMRFAKSPIARMNVDSQAHDHHII